MLSGAPEEIRTPDPQIRSLVFTSYMQLCARIAPVSKVENTRKSDAGLVGPNQAATLVSERNRSYAARTASLPYRRSSRRTMKCARATSWKWSMNA
jgi:hypothetical protein